MAKRRMFSPDVVEMDSFVEMSNEARLLYFYLGLYTDDDGFVNNPRSVARLNMLDIHALDELIENKFVIPFESGVIVIAHWHINNKIRGDRYKETVFKNELNLLKLENNIYILNSTQIYNGIPNDNQMATNGIPSDNQTDTQYKLSKDKLSKSNISKFNKSECNASKENISKEKESTERENHTKVANNIDYDWIVSLLNKIVDKECSLTDSLKKKIDNAINYDYQFTQKLENLVNDLNGQTFHSSAIGVINYIAKY